jgi:hypothetical protein
LIHKFSSRDQFYDYTFRLKNFSDKFWSPSFRQLSDINIGSELKKKKNFSNINIGSELIWDGF